jgi:hypothetical protein
MTRIIRLTESDLTRIVRRVIKEQKSTSDEYVNDPDLKKIESDITTLNGVVSKFKSPYNLNSYGLDGGKRGTISVLQLVKYKKEPSGNFTKDRVIFEIQLGQTKKPFSSGSQFSDENVRRIDTTDAQTLMTEIVDDIDKFSGKFPLNANIAVWAANTKIIDNTQQ